jgi:hypothetical protein
MIKKLEQELMQATTVKYDSQILRTNSQFENINIESSSHNNSNANINANTNITVTANNNITINNDNSEMLMSFKPKKTENVDESAISQN